MLFRSPSDTLKQASEEESPAVDLGMEKNAAMLKAASKIGRASCRERV